MKIEFNSIKLFIFDFDGVLTDNRVYVNEDGVESVVCNRADGLAFDVLRKADKKVIIMSTEKNKVVSLRAKKLQVEVFYGVGNKKECLAQLCEQRDYNLKEILFVGNDLNDYEVMQDCAFSACPSDSHPLILETASVVLKARGGQGVIRELIEELLQQNFKSFL